MPSRAGDEKAAEPVPPEIGPRASAVDWPTPRRGAYTLAVVATHGSRPESSGLGADDLVLGEPARADPDQAAVVALVWREAPATPLIEEQIIERHRALRELGFDARVVFGLRAHQLPKGTDPGITAERCQNFGSLVQLAGRAIAGAQSDSGKPPILLCRSAAPTVAAMTARALHRLPCKVVHDCRGWESAQAREEGRAVARMRKAALERIALRGANHNVVVSATLMGVALSLGARPATTTLIPPLARPRTAGAHGDQPAQVIYVGDSRAFYQSRDVLQPFLVSLAERVPAATFGWLDVAASGEPEWLRENLWRRSLPPEAVASQLEQASVALLIRARSRTNAVAAPTKAGQYLTAGCRILTTPFPVATAEICTTTGAGRVLRSLDSDEWAQAVRGSLDADQRNAPADLYGRVIDRWSDLLRSL